MERTALVTGAGGFIGSHLATRLKAEGYRVRATDVKPIAEWWRSTTAHFGELCGARGFPAFLPDHDLQYPADSMDVANGADDIYHLAADMGGMGFIERNHLRCLQHNLQINTNLIRAILETTPTDNCSRRRVFWSSSACAYPVAHQATTSVTSLPEHLAWQGQPELGYGEEKLASESLFRYLREDVGVETHVARLHNVYGPYTSWNDGREKAPAAICRKVAEAKLSGNHVVTIWGDGTRTRSFMYIDDCIEGIRRLMESDVYGPINLGSEEQVSIRELVEIVADIAGIKVEIKCDMSQPQGVVGRNSDNTLIRETLGWEPKTPLREGLEKTYEWVEEQVKQTRT